MNMKSAVVDGGNIAERSSVDKKTGIITKEHCTKTIDRKLERKIVHSSCDFGYERQSRFSYVMIYGGEDDFPSYCFWQVKSIFTHNRDEKPEQCAVLKYMAVVETLDKIEEVLGCVIVRRRTNEEVDYTAKGTGFEESIPPSP